MRLVLYITKSWSVPLIIATLLSSHIIHLFFIFSFLYLKFSSPYFQKKKKTHLLPISSHTYYYTFSNLSHSFFASLSPHFFTVILLSSFLYFDSFSTHFILYKFDIVFPFNPYFFHTKLWARFSDPDRSLNRKRERFKVFEIEPRSNRDWTVMMS